MADLHETTGPSALPLEALVSETFFGDTRFRPEPLAVAELIQQGVTEETIAVAALARGFQRPFMSLTLRELAVSLPFYQHMSDLLATDHADATLLFAGRDAEVLYDDFAITHPEVTSHLMPASSDLWDSPGMQNQSLATAFLAKFGLTSEALEDPGKKYVVVDSGFYGSIAEALDNKTNELFGTSLLRQLEGRLAIRLVCAEKEGLGTQLLQLPKDITTRWPKLARNRWGIHPRWTEGRTYGLAMGMQLMPRYHGTYSDLAMIADEVIAVPTDKEKVSRFVDGSREGVNTSNVNPFAAAIIQYRVVKAALERVANGTVGVVPSIARRIRGTTIIEPMSCPPEERTPNISRMSQLIEKLLRSIPSDHTD